MPTNFKPVMIEWTLSMEDGADTPGGPRETVVIMPRKITKAEFERVCEFFEEVMADAQLLPTLPE